jgi:hypothetical protein
MAEEKSTGRDLANAAGSLVGHLGAVVLGVVLMIAGIALGVTLVLLPLAIPVGFAGLAFFLWGLFGRAREQQGR